MYDGKFDLRELPYLAHMFQLEERARVRCRSLHDDGLFHNRRVFIRMSALHRIHLHLYAQRCTVTRLPSNSCFRQTE